MIKAQRISALRVTHAYHTVSADAALYLTVTPPGDLLALERKKIRLKMDDPSKRKQLLRPGKSNVTLLSLPGPTDGAITTTQTGLVRYSRT